MPLGLGPNWMQNPLAGSKRGDAEDSSTTKPLHVSKKSATPFWFAECMAIEKFWLSACNAGHWLSAASSLQSNPLRSHATVQLSSSKDQNHPSNGGVAGGEGGKGGEGGSGGGGDGNWIVTSAAVAGDTLGGGGGGGGGVGGGLAGSKTPAAARIPTVVAVTVITAVTAMPRGAKLLGTPDAAMPRAAAPPVSFSLATSAVRSDLPRLMTVHSLIPRVRCFAPCAFVTTGKT